MVFSERKLIADPKQDLFERLRVAFSD